MATKVFLRDIETGGRNTGRGTNSANLAGTNVGWSVKLANTTQGSTVGGDTATRATVTGATAGIEMNVPLNGPSGSVEWITPPLAAAVTISGSITFNLWMAESGMNANAASNCVIDKIAATDQTITQIIKTTRTTEMGSTVPPTTAENFAQTPGAGVACNRGDRLRFRLFADDAGTMASGFTITAYFNGGAAARGDTFCSFTESLTFESDPAGSVIYFTDTAAGIDPGSAIEKEAWTSRGSGVTTAVTNMQAGWVAPIQYTDTAGGTVLEWYTRPLTAFTLSGMIGLNLRAKVQTSSSGQNRAEIAICNTNGTGATVWGVSLFQSSPNPILLTTELAAGVYVGGDDTAVTDGQRIRVRIYIDDENAFAMTGSQTATFYYAGTSGGASGDSFMTLPQTVTEFVTTRVPRSPGVDSGFGHFCKAWQATRRWRHGANGILVPDGLAWAL